MLFVPLKLSALPNFPPVFHVAFESVPALPLPEPSAVVVVMLPHGAHRYAGLTIRQPHSMYVLMACSPPFPSTPMFIGVSIPSRAKMANEKNVRLAGMPSA